MFRGNFTYSDWKYSKVPQSDITDPTSPLGGGNREGDAVLQGSGTASGSKAGVYINSKWAYSANGLYQIAPDHPWGFNAAVNLTGRQGYPVPYYVRVQLPGNENSALSYVQATDRPDSFRLARHQHRRRSPGEGIHLQRRRPDPGCRLLQRLQPGLRPAAEAPAEHGLRDYVREITSPRIFRVGARFSFR